MKLQSYITSLRVCSWLLWFDIRSLWKDFFNNVLDAAAWPTLVIFVNGFILPFLGMPANYGAFSAVSMVIIMASYRAWTGSIAYAHDLAGPQTISYELTLPLPYWMVWLKNSISLGIQSATFNMLPLLIGKLMLWDSFSFSHFSLGHFILIYILSSLFFGIFSLWTTVFTSTPESHTRLEMRLIGPMFFLNGFAASWAAMYHLSPYLAIAMRFLPWVYAYEGTRAAVFGQGEFINFWACVAMLMFFNVALSLSSIHLFKKRMDCV